MDKQLIERLYSLGLLKRAKSADEWLKDFGPKLPISEDMWKQMYAQYMDGINREKAQLDAQFPKSANNTVPYDSFDEFKAKVIRKYNEKHQKPFMEDPIAYYKNNPEAAHEYVYNMIQSGAEMDSLPKDVVEIAKKWEQAHQDEFGEVPVQTPENLPTSTLAGFTFNGLTKIAADKQQLPQVQAPKPQPTIDQTAYKDVKTRLEAALRDNPQVRPQLTDLLGSLASFKAKVEEILVKANTGVLPPTLSDEGYAQLGKELFNANFDQDKQKDEPKPEKDDKKKPDLGKDKAATQPDKAGVADDASLDELLGL